MDSHIVNDVDDSKSEFNRLALDRLAFDYHSIMYLYHDKTKFNKDDFL
jgi:hypothetical protein